MEKNNFYGISLEQWQLDQRKERLDRQRHEELDRQQNELQCELQVNSSTSSSSNKLVAGIVIKDKPVSGKLMMRCSIQSLTQPINVAVLT